MGQGGGEEKLPNSDNDAAPHLRTPARILVRSAACSNATTDEGMINGLVRVVECPEAVTGLLGPIGASDNGKVSPRFHQRKTGKQTPTASADMLTELQV